MDLREILATNLRGMRNETGRTQEEMAQILGVSARYLGSIERNKVSPSVTLLGRFAEALGVPALRAHYAGEGRSIAACLAAACRRTQFRNRWRSGLRSCFGQTASIQINALSSSMGR